MKMFSVSFAITATASLQRELGDRNATPTSALVPENCLRIPDKIRKQM